MVVEMPADLPLQLGDLSVERDNQFLNRALNDTGLIGSLGIIYLLCTEVFEMLVMPDQCL